MGRAASVELDDVAVVDRDEEAVVEVDEDDEVGGLDELDDELVDVVEAADVEVTVSVAGA